MAWLNDGQLSRHNIRRGHSVRSVYLTGEQAARVAKQVETRKQERTRSVHAWLIFGRRPVA